MKVWSLDNSLATKLYLSMLFLPLVLIGIVVATIPALMQLPESQRQTGLVLLTLLMVVGVLAFATLLRRQNAQQIRVFCYESTSDRLFTFDKIDLVPYRHNFFGYVEMARQSQAEAKKVIQQLEHGLVSDVIDEILWTSTLKTTSKGHEITCQVQRKGIVFERKYHIKKDYPNADELLRILAEKQSTSNSMH